MQTRFTLEKLQTWPAPALIRSASTKSSDSLRARHAALVGTAFFDGGGQIRELKFVRHAQQLGFSLNEIKELLALRQKDHACSEVQSMLKHKLTDVREKIKSLVRLEAELRGALRKCNRELRLKGEVKHGVCCPLLTRLGRMNSSNGNEYVARGRKPAKK